MSSYGKGFGKETLLGRKANSKPGTPDSQESFLVQWFSRDSPAPKSTPACVLKGVSGVSGFGVEKICSGSCEQSQ